MTTIDKLRRETADIKEDAVAKNTDKIEDYILNVLTDYYYSYVNNDMARFHAAAEHLEDAITVAYGQYNNVDNFTNYCRVIILTKLMNTVFKRDESLKIPVSEVYITTEDKTSAEIKAKRLKELKERMEQMEYDNTYFKQLEVDMMAEGDYVKHLIRPDVNVDFIRANITTLESILTDEGIAAVKHYMNNGRE